MTHASDHNAIHAVVGLGLPTTLVVGSSGHLGHHNTSHSAMDLGLPTNVTQGSTGHIAAHAAIAGWMLDATVGIRGVAGPSSSIIAPAGAIAVGAGATAIQDAVAANGTNAVFNISGAHAITTRIEPKAGQQFWFQNGSTVTGTIANGFFDLSGRDNVKIMNGTFSGFTDAAISNQVAAGWEIGYNDCSGGVYSLHHYSNARVHHNKCHDSSDGPIRGYQSVSAIVEDNEIGPNVGAANGQKWFRTSNIRVRHNRSHGNAKTALWFDTNNEGVICEWNIAEDSNTGVDFEANPNTNGPSFCRYNLVRNNNRSGIQLHGSAHMRVYQNVLQNNLISESTDQGNAELKMYINRFIIETQLSDLTDNLMSYNDVTIRTLARAARLFADSDVNLQPVDPTPYTTNTKNNNWNFNAYHLTAPAATNPFWWWRTNKTWASWQALPQDVNGSAS